MHNKPPFFAEIIESDLSQWTGQCWKWDNAPDFGSLVTTKQKNITLYGVVHAIKTGSNDPMRTPMAYQKTEEELLRDQPQIFEFLQTTFQAITIGYQKHDEPGDKFYYHLPAQPPKIHAFIACPSTQQYQDFFLNDQFLHLLFNASSQINNLDELLICIIKNLHEKRLLSRSKLTDLIETISILCKHDYHKLKTFLHRIQQITINLPLESTQQSW